MSGKYSRRAAAGVVLGLTAIELAGVAAQPAKVELFTVGMALEGRDVASKVWHTTERTAVDVGRTVKGLRMVAPFFGEGNSEKSSLTPQDQRIIAHAAVSTGSTTSYAGAVRRVAGSDGFGI